MPCNGEGNARRTHTNLEHLTSDLVWHRVVIWVNDFCRNEMSSAGYLDRRLHAVPCVAGDRPVDDVLVQVLQPQLLKVRYKTLGPRRNVTRIISPHRSIIPPAR